MNPKISVIIPVYGVEKYLNRCVESVVKQTYKNLEILLVDDGSPDNCPKMCDDWSLRDARVRTVHRANGGQSCARNTGLSYASGDYITFVDSDDWIAPDTYEYCMGLMNSYTEVDVVEFRFVQTHSEFSTPKKTKEVIEVYNGKDILEYYMDSSTRSGSYSVCRCLFKAPTAKRYRFREGKINEDIDYKYKVLSDCSCMVVSNQVKYFYWQEGNSTSSGKLKARDLQLYEAADELFELTKNETYGKIAYYGRVKKARTPFSLLTRILIWGIGDPSIDESSLVNQLQKELRGELVFLLSSPMSLNRKILAIMMSLNFRLSRFLCKILGHFVRFV